MKKSFIFKISLVVFLFVLAFLALNQKAKATDWQSSTIDSSGNVGKYTSIAVGSNSKIYISYYDVTNTALKYATNASGSWASETVDNTGDIGKESTSMALDSNNKAHISYFDNSLNNLKYATNASGSWVTETLDSSGYVGEYSSIAIASDGTIYISYYDGTNGDLKLATKSPSGAGTNEVIDNTETNVGAYTSLVLDSNGKVHISYQGGNGNTLKYATNVSSSWVRETVDNTTHTGLLTSLALDPNSKAHIAYYDYTLTKVKYATNSSGEWHTDIIDDGAYPSLALDSNNKVHIGYYNHALKYATNASGTWKTSDIDTLGDVGWYTSISVDSSNKIHISYYDISNGDLKYIYSKVSAYASKDSGAYSSVQSISLSSNEIANIYYTTNGSAPTASSSLYTQPIGIKKPTTLKFFVKDLAGDQSEIETKQYIITPTPSIYQVNTIINYNKGKVKLYSNKGKYQKKSFYPFGKSYSGPAIFLTIGDPKQYSIGKIVAATRSKIKVLTKSGKTNYSIKTSNYRVKAADIDLDGKEEILVTWKKELKIFSGKKKIASLKLDRWIKDFAVARLSKPDKPQIVIATWDDKLKVYNYKNKKFKLKKTKNLNLISLSAIDTDNDGLDELAVKKDNYIQILSHLLKSKGKIKKTGTLAIADLNKDNVLEILISSGKKLYSYQKSGKSFKKIKEYSLKGINFGGRL